MNIIEDLVNCQNVLYKGFTTAKESGIEWLNEFCGEFLKFCNKLHKFLVFDCNQKSVVIETCFLCITQVVCCVKYMEKIIKIEEAKHVVLSPSRQYFLDRILWCFAHLKSTINSARDELSNLEDSNFVTSMDAVVDLIEPYSAYRREEAPNTAQFNTQAALDSEKIRTTVDQLLSQTLAFANVALEGDKIALTAICQKVLRECMAFQDCCSLSKSTVKPNSHLRQLRATSFENSLYQLEDFVNESLVRLVFEVLANCTTNSVGELRFLIESSTDEDLDRKIADFDINVDRIMQIGIFAMALSTDVRAKTEVRSSLASLESLDSILIPSLYAKDDLHSVILEEHYYDEIRKFQKAIQDIIDTTAFCKCFEDALYNSIQILQKSYDTTIATDLMEKAKVLDEHFRFNYSDLLKTEQANPTQTIECYDNFKLMLNECQAILACANQVESSRIVKRLNILRSIVKKLTESMSNKIDLLAATINGKFDSQDSAIGMKEIVFESFGITPSVTSILYKPRNVRKISDSMRGNTSKLPHSSFLNAGTPRKSNRRRASLRVAIFKRQKSNEGQTNWTSFSEKSTSLHISDILDQITDLSSTFTKQ